VPNASSPTVVCRGGGLHKYQSTAADARKCPLRFRFQARLSAGVRRRFRPLICSPLRWRRVR
jgi:hypothetical protein